MNPFQEFIQQGDDHPSWFSKEMHMLFAKQKAMLQKYDFLEEKGKACVDWIERFCVLVEGQDAGRPVRLLLWQKWFIYSIFCFYGNIDTELFDDKGNIIGKEKKYLRIVNDVLLLIASGNAKTTLVGFINAYCMFSKEFPACKIYIGSNAYQQSRLCFDTTLKILKRNKNLRKFCHFRTSNGEIEIEKNGSKLVAMSSDGANFEGIIPAVLVIDEIHEMKTSKYAENLRKSTKRDDFLIIESTTDGLVRGGYLDQRKELAEKVLRNESEMDDDRKLFVIFKQDNEEELLNMVDVNIMKKSNPSLGKAVSVNLLKGKIKDMINDPSKKATILTKNFNIPQNPITCYFTEAECKAKPFDESIFFGAPIFLGLDMAYTRNPSNDLTCLEMLLVNPLTNEEYCKDFYFLPKYWKRQTIDNGVFNEDILDMIKYKSKEDSNILYNVKQKKYGYQLYAERGDLVILDEKLNDTLVSEFGPQAKCDLCGITEEFIIYFIAHLELEYKWTILKFGLDPNKASKIMLFGNESIPSTDGKPPMIQFRMEDKKNSNPVIESTKTIRNRRLVYNNNRLTELHFASVTAKESSTGIVFTNAMRERKDGVIANLAARSACNVFLNNKDTGSSNLNKLTQWWLDYEQHKQTS